MEIVGSGGENGLLTVLFAANASSYRWQAINNQVVQLTSSISNYSPALMPQRLYHVDVPRRPPPMP